MTQTGYELVDGSMYHLRLVVYETTAGSIRDRWIVGIDEQYEYVVLRCQHGTTVWDIQSPHQVERIAGAMQQSIASYLRFHPKQRDPWVEQLITDSRRLLHILHLSTKPALTVTTQENS